MVLDCSQHLLPATLFPQSFEHSSVWGLLPLASVGHSISLGWPPQSLHMTIVTLFTVYIPIGLWGWVNWPGCSHRSKIHPCRIAGINSPRSLPHIALLISGFRLSLARSQGRATCKYLPLCIPAFYLPSSSILTLMCVGGNAVLPCRAGGYILSHTIVDPPPTACLTSKTMYGSIILSA